MTATRTVTVEPLHGGVPCPALTDSQQCNTQACPRDCVVSSWSYLGACSLSCGGGVIQASRTVLQASSQGGVACPTLVEYRDCNTEPCAVHCNVNHWSDWSLCTKSCGGGVQERSRSIIAANDHGGNACPALSETSGCNSLSCPVDCVVSLWSAYSTCTKTCGSGSKTRTRSIVTDLAHGGIACQALSSSATCNTSPCPVNCAFSWADWTSCTVSCGQGSKTSSPVITTQAAYGGMACPSMRTEDCNAHPCPRDCQQGTWSDWGACSHSCKTDLTVGSQVRSRTTLVDPAYGGKQCEASTETRSCNVFNCPIDCVVSGWADYGTCSQPCKIRGGTGGLKARSRSVVTAAKHGGVACQTLTEHATCGTADCPDYCHTDLGPWSECTKSCGVGSQSAAILPGEIPYAGQEGENCPTSQDRDCNTHACPIDCVVSYFTSYGECSHSCAGGSHIRTRTIVVSPEYGGAACPALSETKSCNVQACPIDCTVSDWTAFSTCSAPCGGGIITRSRSVTTAFANGGVACPDLAESQNCNTHPCPIHCTFEWKPWSACSQSCGGGSQQRDLVVIVYPKHGGDECPDVLHRTCNTQECPTRIPTKSPTPATSNPTFAPTAPPGPTPFMLPVLTMFGSDSIVLEARHGLYQDQGASCSDSIEGDISDDVYLSGDSFPELSLPGTYTIHYSCENTKQQAAPPLTRTVVVRDTLCPTCVIAPGPQKIEASFPYTDAGATCTDTLSGVLTPTVYNGVDVEKTGVYTVTYRVKDGAGNWNDGQCTGTKPYVRTVKVIDTLRPVIGLKYAGKLVHMSDSSDVSQTVAAHANPAASWNLFGDSLMAESSSSRSPLAALCIGSFMVACAMIAAFFNRRGKTVSSTSEHTPLNSEEQRRLSV